MQITKETRKGTKAMDKLDYAIIYKMQESSAVSPIKAITRKEISAGLEIGNSNLYRKLTALAERGFIKPGIKDSKQYTYYVTKEGLQALKEL